MLLNRRQFLTGSAAALGAGWWALQHTPAARAAPVSTADHCLIVCFLRGGLDGLHLLGPADDPHYVAARPDNLRVTPATGLPLRGAYAGHDWRLHPAAAPLKELYDSGELALIHASGLPASTRSHFEAQDLMEAGARDGTARPREGWLARAAAALMPQGELPVVAFGSATPKSLLGATSAVAMTGTSAFGLRARRQQVTGRVETALAAIYGGGDPITTMGDKTLDAMSAVAARLPREEEARRVNGIAGPLRDITRLRAAGFGTRIATLDTGGWDTHAGQPGRFQTLTTNLSRALHDWWTALAVGEQSRTTVVLLSEFGRRIEANQSQGTDHGRGNVMLILGGGIKGGQCYGDWPGLAPADRESGRDLPVTTDYRVVLADVLESRLGVPRASSLFAGLEGAGRLGLA